MRRVTLLVAVLLVSPVLAQQSTSYKISDHAFNAGGQPAGGIPLVSTTYRLTLSALGDSLPAPPLTSPSFVMDLGLATRYPPPGEVLNVTFATPTTLLWDADPACGPYNLYRAALGDISGSGYGSCFQPGLPAATATDTGLPAAGGGYFYLVTAENLLFEEGTKGLDSDLNERQGTICP